MMNPLAAVSCCIIGSKFKRKTTGNASDDTMRIEVIAAKYEVE